MDSDFLDRDVDVIMTAQQFQPIRFERLLESVLGDTINEEFQIPELPFESVAHEPKQCDDCGSGYPCHCPLRRASSGNTMLPALNDESSSQSSLDRQAEQLVHLKMDHTYSCEPSSVAPGTPVRPGTPGTISCLVCDRMGSEQMCPTCAELQTFIDLSPLDKRTAPRSQPDSWHLLTLNQLNMDSLEKPNPILLNANPNMDQSTRSVQPMAQQDSSSSSRLSEHLRRMSANQNAPVVRGRRRARADMAVRPRAVRGKRPPPSEDQDQPGRAAGQATTGGKGKGKGKGKGIKRLQATEHSLDKKNLLRKLKAQKEKLRRDKSKAQLDQVKMFLEIAFRDMPKKTSQQKAVLHMCEKLGGRGAHMSKYEGTKQVVVKRMLRK